jgi:hypothetical protein
MGHLLGKPQHQGTKTERLLVDAFKALDEGDHGGALRLLSDVTSRLGELDPETDGHFLRLIVVLKVEILLYSGITIPDEDLPIPLSYYIEKAREVVGQDGVLRIRLERAVNESSRARNSTASSSVDRMRDPCLPAIPDYDS